MGEFVYFTEEQKQRANAVDLEDFLSRQGEKLLRSGREKRLASDHSITGSCIPGKRESATRTEKAIRTSRGEPDHAPCFCVSDKDKVCGS